ncbi:MAG: hypothetical protein KGY99_05385 [Phycisphaerae bacterium]|nr:hypothetical protein [Phycisphaerae bacterium]
MPEAPQGGQGQAHAVVTARPVRVQGIVALVLLGLVLVMAAVGAILLVAYGPELLRPRETPRPATMPQRRPGRRPPAEPETDPTGDAATQTADADAESPLPDDGDELSGPRVMTMSVVPPVAYCVGIGNEWLLDGARAEIYASIEALPADARMAVYVSTYEGDVAEMAGGYRPADAQAMDAARDVLDQRSGSGALADAIVRAAGGSPAPKTIVVFAAAPVADDDIARARKAAEAAGAEIIVAIMSPAAADNLKKLATDGRSDIRQSSGF